MAFVETNRRLQHGVLILTTGKFHPNYRWYCDKSITWRRQCQRYHRQFLVAEPACTGLRYAHGKQTGALFSELGNHGINHAFFFAEHSAQASRDGGHQFKRFWRGNSVE